MSKRLNLVNQRFGRFIVKSFSHTSKNFAYWECLCDCGIIKIIRGNDLKTRRTLSCGCLGKERRHAANTTHGMSNTPIFEVWCAIIQRCENPKHKSYDRYGGRGIKVCDRWRNSFQAFHDDMGIRPKNTSIDRIDNNGDYEPSNCRWATKSEQSINTTRNIYITVNGITRTIREWERIQKFNAGIIGHRIRQGWPPEKAVFTPVK